MKKTIIGIFLLFLFFSSKSFAETGNCLLFLEEWDVTIDSDTYTWTFNPGFLNTEALILGEDDNGTQIAITWYELLSAYIATNMVSHDSYYVTFDNETKFSGYHFLDNSILIVGTVPPEDENPSPCPARMVLRDDTAKLNILRDYRDNVLSKTASGQMLTELYYGLGPDICKMLKDNPSLLNPCRLLLNRILP